MTTVQKRRARARGGEPDECLRACAAHSGKVVGSVDRRRVELGEQLRKLLVVHFTGRHKPWQGGESGYSRAEDRWREFELSDADFQSAYLESTGALHHDLIVHYGTPHVARTGDVEAARKVAAAHIASGDYQDAVDILSRVRIPLDEAWPHEVLGHALMSVSRCAEAKTQLLLAAAAPNRAATAYARLAQMAWVHGDHSEALTYATAAQPAAVDTPAWWSLTFWTPFDRTFTESRAWIWSTGSKECTVACGPESAAIIEK